MFVWKIRIFNIFRPQLYKFRTQFDRRGTPIINNINENTNDYIYEVFGEQLA